MRCPWPRTRLRTGLGWRGRIHSSVAVAYPQVYTADQVSAAVLVLRHVLVWPSMTTNKSGRCMMRLKPVFLCQSAKFLGSLSGALIPLTALIRLLLVVALPVMFSVVVQTVYRRCIHTVL